jgi:type I restriction enzyme S subunit
MKPGYKQTEVGVIPEDWEVKRLGELAVLKNGYAFKSDTYTTLGNFKVITIANVQDGFMTTRECNSIACEPKDLQSHQRLQIGDILISMTGNVGRVCRVTEKNCLLNQRVGKLIPTTVDDDMLIILLRQPSFIMAMTGVAKGGAQPNLSVSEISDHRFCVPASLPEQRAIAEALSDVDGLLGGLDRLIAKKRDLKQAAMQQLLTGQTRLPGFHGEWEVKRLAEVCWFQEGPGVRNTQFTAAGVKLLNGTNIFRGVLNLETTGRFISESEAHGAYAHFLADEGDIVLASSGITVERLHEKVAFIDGRFRSPVFISIPDQRCI